jgi:HAD superfamily hydrolase (TIGR01509 family)
MTDLGALIFDFDGTIADSEPFHLAAFQRTFSEELGLELTEAQYRDRYLAFDDRTMVRAFLADREAEVEPARFERLLEVKEAHYEALGASPRILPGAAELIRAASARWPLAVASGALEGEIRPVLEAAGLLDCFGPIVSAEMVERGKPDPESFLTALGRINEALPVKIRPEGCLVLEDSVAGVGSGRAAGMRVLAVTNSFPREALSGADRVVDSLEEIADTDALAAWFLELG